MASEVPAAHGASAAEDAGADVPAGPDALGLPVEGDVAGVSRALLDGVPVVLRAEVPWPLPPLPVAADGALTAAAAADGAYTIRVTDRVVEPAGRQVVLRPPSLVVGVGAARGAPVGEVLGLVEEALRDAGLCVASVAELATVDTKSGEPGIVGAAEHLGVPLVAYPAGELADVEVPNPSDAPLAAAGTASVAEAAALVGGGELLVPKRKSAAVPARATCAVVRRPARGRLAAVGPGPGARDPVTPRARAELRRASGPVGPDQHVDQVHDDSCGYRIPLPGFGDKAGLPHFHPDDDRLHGHRHGQGHVHSHAY
ncbi:hypothetical protein TPA0905_59000 [Streptomyces olivaceus]|nr:hypothetical protein TPA0905_59000 [Streptomyces olivaceus]